MPTVTGQKDTLAAALVAVQAQLRNPAFDKENTAFRQNGKVYRYASLAAHLDAVRPVITKHGLAITQLIQGRDGNLEVTTQLVHESGEVMGATIAVPLPAGGAHGIMGMITYLRRGQMASLLGIVGDDDNDGNEVAEPKAQQGARMPQEKPAPLARVEAAIAGKIAPNASKPPQKAEGGGVIVGRMERVYLNEGKSPHKIVLEDGTIMKAWQSDTEMVESLQAGEEYRFFTKWQKGRNGHPDDLFLTGFEVAKPAEVAPEEIPF